MLDLYFLAGHHFNHKQTDKSICKYTVRYRLCFWKAQSRLDMQVFIQRLTFNMVFFILQMPGFYFLFGMELSVNKRP